MRLAQALVAEEHHRVLRGVVEVKGLEEAAEPMLSNETASEYLGRLLAIKGRLTRPLIAITMSFQCAPHVSPTEGTWAW